MSQNMLENYEEMLQGDVIWVELSPEPGEIKDGILEVGGGNLGRLGAVHCWPETGVDHLFDNQLGNVDQVTPLNQHGVTFWNERQLRLK